MWSKATIVAVAVWICLPSAFTSVYAQQPQIPTLQVCNLTKVNGRAAVKIDSRSDATHLGVFKVAIEVKCDPEGLPYPDGVLVIGVDMSDSVVQGSVFAQTIEQVTSTGEESPTVYLNGRCTAEAVRGVIPGCRFWLMIADNRSGNGRVTPDVIGFLILNGVGQRVAYGTGPVVEGDITVASTSN